MGLLFPELSSVKVKRQKLGLKQKELAKNSRVSQSLIAKLESGKLVPSYDIVKTIFRILDSSETQKEKKCSDIMSTRIISINPDFNVKKAIDLMKKHSVSQLPVIKQGKVMGSISESVIYNKIAEGISKEKIESSKISEIMAEPFPIVRSDYPVSSVISLLKSSEAVLLTKEGKIAGIITKVDVI
jgi:predicted transcriptional regulator